MRRYLIVSFLHLSLFSQSQKIQHDWENYVLAVDGKPVSVNVNLGLSSKAPIKERPFVIILRTKIKNPDTGKMIKLKTALGYEKDTKAYKAAQFSLKKK